ncbi:uncharacterized protein LOC118223815 isoform X2 [Anguilla anguilla]|uniref:uncharacterized protein LOC118223815 isoform X2 n=1 Tax=Anguilla anguilla TaxID=7936 RepID=UPI0015AB5736|nr:uncharacterized protein LOC118223815 isoform X2 [Anguilla anguilla]
MARTYISVLMLYGTSLIGRALLAEVSSVVVKRGDTVTLPCSFRMSGAGGYMGWFRHGPNDSVPLCIFSVYDSGHSEVKHHNNFRRDHIKLLRRTNSSFGCEIINVDLSDSGLYFCGKMGTSKVVFDSATRVEVEDVTDNNRRRRLQRKCMRHSFSRPLGLGRSECNTARGDFCLGLQSRWDRESFSA